RAVLERAKAEAAALLTDIRRAVSSEWERLKRADRSRPALQESRRRLQDAAARVLPAVPDLAPTDSPLTPGAPVVAAHLGLKGGPAQRAPRSRQGHGGAPQDGAHAALEPSAGRIVPGRRAVRGWRGRHRRRAEGQLRWPPTRRPSSTTSGPAWTSWTSSGDS